MQERMAEYMVNRTRLGGICWKMRTSSPNETRLDPKDNEILGAALIFGMLGLESVNIVSKDPAGNDLERPDLDVTFSDRSTVGFEAADVVETHQGKHASESEALRTGILDLRANDASFATAFGSRRIVVFLSSPLSTKQRIEGKSERQAIQSELEQFIRAGEHTGRTSGVTFSRTYPTLHSRGATWHSSPFPVPGFDVGHGAGGKISDPAISEIIRVLDKHRSSAATYRKLPLWIGLIMTDRWEFLRGTLDAVAASPPQIAPFERCYLADDGGRVLELRDGSAPVFVGIFAPTAGA